MADEKITDHEDQAVERLASQFRGKERIEGLVRSLVKPLQTVENVLDDFKNFTDIDSAIGAQLDIWGKIVGQKRGGRDDHDYRLAIKAKIGINTSKGTAENLIATFSFLTRSQRVHLTEAFPGEVMLFADNNFEFRKKGDGADAFAFDGGVDGLGFGSVWDEDVGGTLAYLEDEDVIGIFIILEHVAAAGVRVNFLGWYDGDEAFSFSGDEQGKGFGSVYDATVGGRFAKLVQSHIPFSFASDTERTRGFGSVYDNIVGGELASAA